MFVGQFESFLISKLLGSILSLSYHGLAWSGAHVTREGAVALSLCSVFVGAAGDGLLVSAGIVAGTAALVEV